MKADMGPPPYWGPARAHNHRPGDDEYCYSFLDRLDVGETFGCIFLGPGEHDLHWDVVPPPCPTCTGFDLHAEDCPYRDSTVTHYETVVVWTDEGTWRAFTDEGEFWLLHTWPRDSAFEEARR